MTVGSELTSGLRVDTNTAAIATEIASYGFDVAEAVSVPDNLELLAGTISRLAALYPLVVVTGGLGPTHDDVTREAAARALGKTISRDTRLERLLEPAVCRHRDEAARRQVLNQADVIEGATIFDPTTGTAPGLSMGTTQGELLLLPGPPNEMLPMLRQALSGRDRTVSEPHELCVSGMTESEAQITTSRAIAGLTGVGFTVLSSPGDVRVLLSDGGGGTEALASAVEAAASALGDNCYSVTGESLAEVVLRAARAAGRTIATAESCTGGLVAAALTDVAGASDVFLGGLVTYSDAAKVSLLGVDPTSIARHGAVSAEVARMMATGARQRLGADIGVAVTGIAGPGGGSADKPVGTVWFAVADGASSGEAQVTAFLRRLPGGRRAVRQRSTTTALDALRRGLLGMPIG